MKYIIFAIIIFASCKSGVDKQEILVKLKNEQKALKQIHELTVAAERSKALSAVTSSSYNEKADEISSEESKTGFDRVAHRIDSLQELLAK